MSHPLCPSPILIGPPEPPAVQITPLPLLWPEEMGLPREGGKQEIIIAYGKEQTRVDPTHPDEDETRSWPPPLCGSGAELCGNHSGWSCSGDSTRNSLASQSTSNMKGINERRGTG